MESPENNSVGGKTVVNNYNSYDNFTVTINYYVEVEEGRVGYVTGSNVKHAITRCQLVSDK